MAYRYKREDQAYGYDKDTDYSQKMSEAAAAGDYASAARYEQQRNEKIKGEGLTQYQPTRQYAQYLPKSEMRSADDVLDRILSRADFSYDLGGDALYQQYKDQYLQQGKRAMQDTMGQAAALTGGYGNSYAQTVGQQAYNQYLGQLNAVVPELYSLALRRYEKEGNDLWNLYGIYADRENQDYNRYLDERDFNYRQEWDNKNFDYQQEWNNRNFDYQQEWNNKNFDYQQEWDNRNFDYQQEWDNRNFDYEQAQSERNTAFELAMWMLQSGVMPSDTVLTSAGLSAADAQAIYGSINASSGSTGKGTGKTGTTLDDESSVFTYDNGMTRDDVASAALDYHNQYPNVAYDSRTIDMWLSQNGYYGDAAQYFKKVLVALGARNEREIGNNTDSGNS